MTQDSRICARCSLQPVKRYSSCVKPHSRSKSLGRSIRFDIAACALRTRVSPAPRVRYFSGKYREKKSIYMRISIRLDRLSRSNMHARAERVRGNWPFIYAPGLRAGDINRSSVRENPRSLNRTTAAVITKSQRSPLYRDGAVMSHGGNRERLRIRLFK